MDIFVPAHIFFEKKVQKYELLARILKTTYNILLSAFL